MCFKPYYLKVLIVNNPMTRDLGIKNLQIDKVLITYTKANYRVLRQSVKDTGLPVLGHFGEAARLSS